MAFPDEVSKILDENATRPLDAYQKAREILRDAVKPGGRFDPLSGDNEWKEGRDGYDAAHNWFKKRQFFSASEKMLLEWWDDLGSLQMDIRRKIYRAQTAFLLTDLYWEMGDQGMAFRWAMHMQADDILHGNPDDGGAGRQMLPTKLGMEDKAFSALNEIAKKNFEQVKQTDDWTQPAGFAEDAFTKFSKSKISYVIARASSHREMRVSKGYLQSLYTRMTELDKHKVRKYSSQKGKALEDIAFYLCLLLPGCVPHSNVLAKKQVYETDIVVQNLSSSSSVVTDLLGREFIVECKNRQVGIRVSEIGYFLYRMKLTHTKFGILFTRKGITGDKSHSAGAELIRQAYQLDDLLCIVLTDIDLDELSSGKQQYFWWMMLDKIESLRFGKQKSG